MNSSISNLNYESNGLNAAVFDMSTLEREDPLDRYDNIFVSRYNASFDPENCEFPQENKIEPESQLNQNDFSSSPKASRTTQISGEEGSDDNNTIDFPELNSKKLVFKKGNSKQTSNFDQSIDYVCKPESLCLNEEEPEAFSLHENPESQYFSQNLIKKSNDIHLMNGIDNTETKKNQKQKSLLTKKTKRSENSTSNSSLETNIEHQTTSSKAKKTRKKTGDLIKMEEEEKKLEQIQSLFLSEQQGFPLLKEEILSHIALQYYLKPDLNGIKEETETEKSEAEKPRKVSPRMEFADAIYKKINIHFIRIPLIELSKYLIDSHPNYTSKEKIVNKKKLMFTDLSEDVTIDGLIDLHYKTLREIFRVEYFTSEPKLYKKKDESEELFEIRKKRYLIKKEKKRRDNEKILSDIAQLPIFKEIASVRVNEIYNQITDNKILKQTILKYIASKYPDPKYLEMFAEIVEERKNTFELKGNERHQNKQ